MNVPNLPPAATLLLNESLSHSEAGRLIVTHDWSSTVLGPIEKWPQSLRTMLSFVLRSPLPIVLLWGPEGIMLYNDAYSIFAGKRHPELLGSEVRRGWPEVAEFNDNVMKVGLGGGTLSYRDLELTLHRHGQPERVFMNLDYSPVEDESGQPAGVVAIVVETTEQVLARRRDAFRLVLEQSLRDLSDPVQIMAEAAQALGRELDVARVGYGEIDAAEEHVIVERDWCDGRLGSVAGRWRMDDFGLEIIAELRAGRTMWVDDVQADPRVGPSAEAFAAIGTRSVLAVPLFTEERFVAMLYLHHPEPHRWDPAEVALCQEVMRRTREAVERARAETRLRESEERLRLAADAARIGTWDFDLATGTGQWDEAAARIGGLPQDGLFYDVETWLRAIHPEDRDCVSATFRGSLEPGGQPYEVQFRSAVPAEDGGARWLTSHGAVFRDPKTGVAVRAVGIVRDVTDRHRREERLAASEGQLRLGLAAGRMVAWTFDLDSKTVTRSENADGIFGPGATVDAFNDRMPPEDVVADRARLEAAMEGVTDRYVSEFRYRHPDGRLLWLQNWGHVIRNEDGRPIRLHGVCIDVTERKEAELALASSEERLRLAQDAGEIGLWDWDLRTGRMIWSGSYYRVWGIDPSEPPSYEGFLARLDPEQKAQIKRSIDEAFATGSPWSAEMRVPSRDGSVRSITARGEFRPGTDGQAARMIGVCLDITAEKAAEERAQTSERQFRTLVDTVPSFVWFAAPNGELHYLNGRWYEFTGQTPEEALPDGWAKMLHPDDAERTSKQWADARAQERTYEIEVRYRRHDGAYRWYVARAEPLRDSDGIITAWFGTSTDIHERKTAETALRELNETLEQRVAERTQERDRLWRQSRDLMCVARTDGTLLNVNPAWERLLGWPLDWLTGRNAAEIKHPDDAERTAAELSRLAAGYPTLGFEDRYRHQDGSWRWISWAIQPEGDLITCVGRDVTAEKETRAALEVAEAARREADALYRAYFQNTPEALFVIGVKQDGGLVVEEVNPAHETGVGFKIEDIRGKRVDEVLPPDVARRVIEAYRRVTDTGEVYQYREVFHLDRVAKHWDTSLVPIKDKAGRVVRLIGSSRDVTRQVLAEEALRQSQKMEAVGQLTGGIAHDFNNLLGAVVGCLDLIRRKPSDAEKVRRFAEAGLEAAERGSRLTGQLLAFSRAQRLELRSVAARDLVEGMRDLLSRTLGPMVRLSIECKEDGAVLSDPTQLEMAVLNMAINARDAMPEGGDLTISTDVRRMQDDAELADGEYVELSVKDTGSGMSAEVVARAFDPFFTTKGTGKGTGLGLSQVYGMARQAGGTARIESLPGNGTNVCVYLPRTAAEVRPKAESQSAEVDQASSAATILVVDDDADVRRMLVISLDSLGHRVLEAEDGLSGLAALAGTDVDLMIVDFAMPGMNGAEVARAARQRWPDLPIMIASGYADTDAIEGAIGKDAPVLRKPFRVDDLQAKVEESLLSRPPKRNSLPSATR